MARGRDKIQSSDRYLVELLLERDRAVFVGQLADRLDVTPQTVRNNMEELEESGLVEIDKVSNRNLYRLTDDGHDYVAEKLRELID